MRERSSLSVTRGSTSSSCLMGWSQVRQMGQPSQCSLSLQCFEHWPQIGHINRAPHLQVPDRLPMLLQA